MADLDTAATLFSPPDPTTTDPTTIDPDTPDPATTWVAAGFAPWTDAAAAARTIGVTTLNLTKTGW